MVSRQVHAGSWIASGCPRLGRFVCGGKVPKCDIKKKMTRKHDTHVGVERKMGTSCGDSDSLMDRGPEKIYIAKTHMGSSAKKS